MKKILSIIITLVIGTQFIIPTLAAEEQIETLKVGMECNYAPFNWTQINDEGGAVAIEGGGYCNGYDVQMAKTISDQLGKKLVIVKMTWDGLEPALQSGVIDAVIAGMTDTEERRLRVSFSDPYYESDMVIVVKKNGGYEDANSLHDFKNARILGQLNTLYDTVIDQIPEVQHATALEDYPSMLTQLKSGLVDGISAERPVAGGIVASNSDLTFVEFKDGQGFKIDPSETSVSIAVNKENTELLANINQILKNISQDERKKMMNDMISLTPSSLELSDHWLIAAGQIFKQYYPVYFSGVKNTLILAFLGTVLGLCIGLLVGAFRAIELEENISFVKKIIGKFLKLLTSIYIEVFRGTPMMVQAVFIYYGLKNVLDWSPLIAGVFVITINTGAYMSEIMRAGIQSVDKGQVEGARSIGLSNFKTMLYVVLPQAIRNSFPSIGNEFVVNIKDSSVLNIIALTELFYQAKSVAGSLYAFVPSYFVVAIIYLSLTLPTTRILGYIEKRMNKKKNVVISVAKEEI